LSLDSDEPEVAAAEDITPSPDSTNGHRSQLQVALAIRTLRHRNGLSQRQLALRMQVPRTYVSKIENEKATPTLSSLARLAKALEVTVPALLEASCEGHDQEVRELLSDPFIAELTPYINRLDAMQRSVFLTQVREMTTRPRRTA